MRSFVVWYSSNNHQNIYKEIKIHINLWDKYKNKDKKYCFDFGFLIEDLNEIESIFLYIPFEVKKNQVKDLGSIISNNRLVNAIFNENFNTTDGEPKRLIINGKNESSFVIYSLDINNQVEILNTNAQGSILKINTTDIKIEKQSLSRYYFRIRIEGSNENIHLIHDEVKGRNVFSDQFTNTEIIDFRLNDIRSCNEEIREKFNNGKEFNISAIHYLILRNANDIIIHCEDKINSRVLEKELWKDYIDDVENDIIAYHIKKKRTEDEYVQTFSSLVRFQSQKTNIIIIIIYVLGIITLGAIGGVVGNIISKIIGI